MMRILMISPVNPFPANTGGLVRIVKLFEGLSRFHEVTLAIPDSPQASGPSELPGQGSIVVLPSKPPDALKLFAAFLDGWPFHASLYYSWSMNKGIQTLIQTEPYSLIYCHFIYTLPYVKGSRIPVVLDQHNVDRQYWTRKMVYHQRHRETAKYWFSRINRWKTVRFENAMLRTVNCVVSVSQDDAVETRKFVPANITQVLVAPNGVDTDHFALRPSVPRSPLTELVIGFLGSLDLELNQRAAFAVCKEILPRVQSSLRDMKVSALIIGRNPPKELVRYAQDNSAAQITITGTVEDVLPYLHKVDVLALPLDSGAGTKLRVLEAMSAGTCVVGNDLALMGIEGLVPGEHAFLARNIEEFVTTICALARDPESLRRVRTQARQLVEQRFSWNLITGRLSCELAELYPAQ